MSSAITAYQPVVHDQICYVVICNCLIIAESCCAEFTKGTGSETDIQCGTYDADRSASVSPSHKSSPHPPSPCDSAVRGATSISGMYPGAGPGCHPANYFQCHCACSSLQATGELVTYLFRLSLSTFEGKHDGLLQTSQPLIVITFCDIKFTNIWVK